MIARFLAWLLDPCRGMSREQRDADDAQAQQW